MHIKIQELIKTRERKKNLHADGQASVFPAFKILVKSLVVFRGLGRELKSIPACSELLLS